MKSLLNKIDKSNHIIWLNDYKISGKKSYVYKNKDILHELYRDYELCVNDEYIMDEALDYANSINEYGKAIMSMYGVSYSATVANLKTLNEAALSNEMLNIAINNQILMDMLIKNDTFRLRFKNDSTFVNYILDNTSILIKILEYTELVIIMTQSPLVVMEFAKNTNDWEKKKPFVLKINENNDYISNINEIVKNTSYFELKGSGGMGDPNTYNDFSVDNAFKKYGTETYAKNGIILITISPFYSDSPDDGELAKVTVNDEVIKVINQDNISSDSPNVMAIPTALLYKGIRRSQSYKVYIAK